MHNKILPAIATAFFAIMLSGFSTAFCTDCNLVGVSMASDANEYTIGNAQNIILSIKIDKAALGPETIGYKILMSKPGFSAPIDITAQPPTPLLGEEPSWAVFPIFLTKNIPVDSLQPGLYQFNLVIPYVTAPGHIIYTSFEDAVTSDNYASVYITVKKQSMQVPETTPLLAFIAAAGALLILSGSGRHGNRTI